MTTATSRLSGFRTFVLVGLAVVWFSEGVLTGVRPLAEGWTTFWRMFAPADATLAATLYITHAFHAPLKAALFILAVFALRSRDPAVRTPLYVSMALVPPLNIAFHFRAQGFPPVSMTIATTLSAILWGTLLLTREPAEPSPRPEVARSNTAGRSWFALSAAVLAFLGLLFLLAPNAALYGLFPCLNTTFDARQDQLSSLTVSMLAGGSHLTALATAVWFATVRYRTTPALRPAVAFSTITLATLMCALPLQQVVRQGGWTCARSPILLTFVLLLVGWMAYAIINRARGDT